jgi:riboflavin biosynthesis pyrimidine reductase
LSSAADKEVFFFLRGIADVVLAGASTVRAENYGPARLAPDVVAERERRGQAALPRIAVVTRSMKLDWAARLFAPVHSTPKPGRPFILCPAVGPEAEQAAAARVADVIVAGETSVNLAEALRTLAAQGVRVVLGEGGPTLNGDLLAAGLVDELCLTLSPALVGGTGRRISGWTQSRQPLPLELLTVAEADNALLLRYAVKNALQD